MYPIRFDPIYKDYIWGGDRIITKYGRKVSGHRIAESWEVTDREEGTSVVNNGPFKGKTLHQLVSEMGEDLLGKGRTYGRFPLLLKIIDANENLSIQVHPDEQTASDLKGEAKSEMWFSLEESSAYAGFKEEMTSKSFFKAVKEKKAEKFLEKIELKKGEVVYLPGGRIHAICAGSLVYEIQQNSNTTYRIYDWGREGRELHLKEGATAIHWNDCGPAKLSPHHLESDLHHQIVTLNITPFFIVERIDVFDHHHVAAIPKTFQIFFCIEGKGSVSVDGHRESFDPGNTYLIPATSSHIEIDGKCELLRIRLP